MSFFEPDAGVSHSLLKRTRQNLAAKELTVAARRLDSIMSEMGDDSISILKIDIEGYEIVLIPALIELFRKWERHRWPRLLLFDMDSMRPQHKQHNTAEGLRSIKMLENAGYEIFSSEGYDYTFTLKMT